MSHYTTIELQVKDRACFIQALQDVWPRGLRPEHVENHTEARHLYGFEDDRRAQKAHVIVRRRHVGDMANDIGFAFDGEGRMTAYISEFDAESNGYGSRFVDALKQRYARNLAVKDAGRRGYRVREQRLPDGSVELLLEK